MKKKRKAIPLPQTWPQKLSDRCRRVREASGLSQREFITRAGRGRPNAVSDFERGKTESIPLSMLALYVELAEMNGISPAWCLAVSEDPQGHAEHATSMERGGWESEGLSALDVDWSIADAPDEGFRIVDGANLPSDWQSRFVPVIGRIAAGLAVDTVEAEGTPPGVAFEYLEFSGAPKTAFALRVSGSSMEPEYRDGDLVVVDPTVHVSSGICAVITHVDGDRVARIKRLRIGTHEILLESTNPRLQADPGGAGRLRRGLRDPEASPAAEVDDDQLSMRFVRPGDGVPHRNCGRAGTVSDVRRMG